MPRVEQFVFQDEQFMSAAEKQLVLRAWTIFLRHGCRLEHFSERLYGHLSLHCSFIAHFNRHGFYEFYFSVPCDHTYRFLDQFDPGKAGVAAELGELYWLMDRATGSDLNHAMREAAGPYMARLRYQFRESEKQTDLAAASFLAAKYGMRPADGQAPHGKANAWTGADPVQREDSTPEQLSMFTRGD